MRVPVLAGIDDVRDFSRERIALEMCRDLRMQAQHEIPLRSRAFRERSEHTFEVERDALRLDRAATRLAASAERRRE